MEPIALDHAAMSVLNQQTSLLVALVVINALGLIALGIMVVSITGAVKQLQERLDKLLADWEPRLIGMEADFKRLQIELMERLDQSEAGMSQMQALMARADGTLEELAPKLERIATDAEQLTAHVRVGLAEFQQAVMPKLKAVSGVAGALREGFGIFQQLQNNRRPDRR